MTPNSTNARRKLENLAFRVRPIRARIRILRETRGRNQVPLLKLVHKHAISQATGARYGPETRRADPESGQKTFPSSVGQGPYGVPIERPCPRVWPKNVPKLGRSGALSMKSQLNALAPESGQKTFPSSVGGGPCLFPLGIEASRQERTPPPRGNTTGSPLWTESLRCRLEFALRETRGQHDGVPFGDPTGESGGGQNYKKSEAPGGAQGAGSVTSILQGSLARFVRIFFRPELMRIGVQ
jgi:hypothetical protein